MPTAVSPRISLRRLFDAFAERDDPYAGADRENAARIVALIWLLSALITAIFLAFEAPTKPLGSLGWVLAAAVIVAEISAGIAVRRRRDRIGFAALLGITYLGIALTGVMIWLGGGWFSPYAEVLLVWVGCGMGIHPPRRALTVILAAALVIFAPIAYEGWNAAGVKQAGAELVIWTLLGTIVLTLMTHVRAQRVALRSQTDSATALARVDSLTGLGNRRAFDEILGIEIDRARSTGGSLSIALLDLDGFKELNDRFGHLEGDTCLRRAADKLERGKRGGDHVFRWGGDEFAIIVPGATEGQARAAVARIARLEPPIVASDGTRLSFSFGIARLEDGMTARELLERADLELFAAKRDRDTLDRV